MKLTKLVRKINRFNYENEDYIVNLTITNRIVDDYLLFELSLINMETGLIEEDSKLVMVTLIDGDLEYLYKRFTAYINEKYK